MQYVKFYFAMNLQISARLAVLCSDEIFCLLKLATTFLTVYYRYLTNYRSCSLKATGKLLQMWWLRPPLWSMRMLILKMPHGNFIIPVLRKELCPSSYICLIIQCTSIENFAWNYFSSSPLFMKSDILACCTRHYWHTPLNSSKNVPDLEYSTNDEPCLYGMEEPNNYCPWCLTCKMLCRWFLETKHRRLPVVDDAGNLVCNINTLLHAWFSLSTINQNFSAYMRAIHFCLFG